jgi:hypothetical protein
LGNEKIYFKITPNLANAKKAAKRHNNAKKRNANDKQYGRKNDSRAVKIMTFFGLSRSAPDIATRAE